MGRSIWASLAAGVAVLGAGAEGRCSPEGRGTPSLGVGDATYVCVVLSSSLDWKNDTRYLRVAFKAEVDSFARLEVAGAWTPGAGDGLGGAQGVLASDAVALSVQSEGRRSYQKRWRAVHGGVPSTFPVLAAEIYVEAGKVKSIAWDDGCYGCEDEKGECVENDFEYDGSAYRHAQKQCAVADGKCAKSGGTAVSELCKLRIYVTWTGTDKDGRALLSQQNRFSRLDKGQVATFVSDLGSESTAL